MTRIRTALLALVLVAVAAVTARAQNNPTINYAALRADILANTAQAGGTNPAYATTPINQLPINDDTNQLVADWYNRTASPAFYVYRTAIPVQEVNDAIVWQNMTPADPVPNESRTGSCTVTASSCTGGTYSYTVTEAVSIWNARANLAQGKVLNVQSLLLSAQGALNGAKPAIRSGLQDALTNVPTNSTAQPGTSGNNFHDGRTLSAGWVALRDTVLAEGASRVEKLFANTTGGNGGTPATAATMVFEGTLSVGDVSAARAN